MNFPEHELHFFQKFGLTGRLIERCLGEALSAGGDFADLYFESIASTSIRSMNHWSNPPARA
jgi:TldD protein